MSDSPRFIVEQRAPDFFAADLSRDLDFDHFDSFAACDCARALLAKLSVGELRLLMSHYCAGKPRDYCDLSKAVLIEEIAPEYARDQLGAA